MTTAWCLATGMLFISLPDTDRTGNCNGTDAADIVLQKSESVNNISPRKTNRRLRVGSDG
jgi:hypothetical protein